MPTGPKGTEKRPADVVGNAVDVMKVLTGGVVHQFEFGGGTGWHCT
jgi:hypothetical protein